ncbi:MAG: hypothetical protein EA411_06955 [Saprospirales bacterium]|nr:MAG: hypothetical protein EA411_06955 [Saprospirales bacterium]
MDSTALNTFNKIVADTTIENHFFVTVNPIESVAVEKAIPILLPSHSDTIVNFTHNWLDYRADSNYVWHGFLYEKDSSYIHTGRGTLISEDGKKYGSFRIDSIYYDLIDLGGNTNILVQYEHTELELECGVPEFDSLATPPEPPDSSLIAEYRDTGPCPINVLILYSEGGEAKVQNNIQQIANISFEQTLDVLRNSDIRASDFHLNLVGIEFLPKFNELVGFGGVWNELLQRWTFSAPDNSIIYYLTNPIQSPTNDLYILREEHEADWVLILGEVDGWIPGLSGVAVLGPNENAPVAIVDAGKSTKNYLFVHELGHLFGCHHEECSAPWAVNCVHENIQARHPHRWKNKKWGGLSNAHRFSVMYSLDSEKTRAFFSNPDVENAEGNKTGTEWRNNAAWLKDMGCIISNWSKNETPPLFSHITAPTKACTCAHVTFHAHAEGGTWESYHYT